MRNKLLISLFFLLICNILFSEMFVCSAFIKYHSDYNEIIENVNIEIIKQHVKFFSSFETRSTGYFGCDSSAEYIYSKFIEYGLMNVSFHEYELAECIDYGANMTFLSEGSTFKIYPLKPNFGAPSTTSPEGIRGTLLYVGDGSLGDFDGLQIEGNIIAMNWGTGKNWITAAKLGAKAVIFLPPNEWEILLSRVPETVDVPFAFPRFFVPDREIIMEHIGEQVEIKAHTCWRKLKAKNVFGFIRGNKYPDQYVILAAHYDSGGIVPSFAPGARESIGISVLLELARWLSNNPPKYSVWFIAFSGHAQSLAGGYNFVLDYIWPAYNLTRRSLGNKIIWWMDIDISTGSSSPYITTYSNMLYYAEISREREEYFGRFFENIANEIKSAISKGRTFEVFIEAGYSVGQIRPLALTNVKRREFNAINFEGNFYGYPLLGFACLFTTAYDSKLYYWQPYDTFSSIGDNEWNNVKAQAEFLYCFLYRVLNEDLKVGPKIYDYTRVDITPPSRAWVKVCGKVGFWNETALWYEPVPNALLRLQGFSYFSPYSENAFNVRWTFADENGYFEFWGAGLTAGQQPWRINAFIFDESTGSPIYISDFGEYAYGRRDDYFAGGTLGAYAFTHVDLGWLAVFKASSVVIFDIIDSLTMSPPHRELGTKPPIIRIQIFEHTSLVTPKKFSIFVSSGYPILDFKCSIAVVAIPPEQKVIFTLTSPFIIRFPQAILTNASEMEPLGFGYRLREGQQFILTNTLLEYAKDLFYSNEDRFNIILHIDSKERERSFYRDHLRTKELINQARNCLMQHNYTGAFIYSIHAWRLANEVYMYLRPKIEDSAMTVPLLATLFLPFVFLFERLIFHAQGKKRLITAAIVFILILIFFYTFHPGFSLASNAGMIILGVSIFILSLPIMAIIMKEILNIVKSIRIKRLGIHEIETGKWVTALWSFTLGVENMRRRKFRSTLTLVSIVLMVVAFVSLSSLETLKIETSLLISQGEEPLYKGVYIRKMSWGEGIPEVGEYVLEYVRGCFNIDATILPRIWVYSDYATYTQEKVGFRLENPNSNISLIIRSLWGLTSAEEKILSRFLIRGCWFVPEIRSICILPRNIAFKLGVDIGDVIKIDSKNYRVIGIVDDLLFQVREIDGEHMSPLKMDWTTDNPYNVHYLSEDTALIPYKDALSYTHSFLASVSIIPKNESQVELIAKELHKIFPGLNIYYSTPEGKIYLKTLLTSLTLWGIESQLILWFVLCLSISNIILGGVHERIRELHIYASLGLSPLSVAFLFLSEAVVYAIIGGVVGYLLSISMNKIIFVLFPLVPSQNLSSSAALMAIYLSIISTVIPAIYPMYKSAKIVVPSLERKWKIPTKPVGDFWEIPFPFYSSSEEETRGILAYLFEFFSSHLGERLPVFSVEKLRFIDDKNEKGEKLLGLLMIVRLSPYERGVVQKTSVELILSQETRKWYSRVLLERLGGSMSDWINTNNSFLRELRQQFLIWRSLTQDGKKEYIAKSKYLKGEENVS
ncbi:MAG: M28 family peptidase [Candidatus Bathyarchaeia archaeon]